MKVYEVLGDTEELKNDLKNNRGRAVKALVRGVKRKTNGVPTKDNSIAKETDIVG